MLCCSQVLKILYVQAKATHLCYEKLKNRLLDRIFVVIKMDPYLLMSKTLVCMVYVDDCLFWGRSQSDIDNVMSYFKYNRYSYNWGHSKLKPVSEFLSIGIKTLDDYRFQFFQTGLIQKVLEATGMEHCNGFQTHTKS